MKLLPLAVSLSILVTSVSAQELLPGLRRFPDWAQRDAEGRWALFVADERVDAECVEAWVDFLGEQRAWTELEWIATSRTMHSRKALDLLRAADAPQWLRVASWRTRFVDSHDLSAALDALRAEPDLFHAWGSVHVERLEPKARELLESLPPPAGAVGDTSRYLPPFTEAELLEALARASDAIAFGARRRALPGEVYVQQVERSIAALQYVRTRSAPALAGLLATTRHADVRLAVAACLAHSHLAPADVPMDGLLDLARDVTAEPEQREAAFLAATYGLLPRVEVLLLDVASRPAHEHWAVALSRLGDLGDRFAREHLERISRVGMSDEQELLLRRAIGKIGETTMDGRTTRRIVERLAWAEIVSAPFAPELTRWTYEALKLSIATPEVAAELRGIQEGYEPREGTPDELASPLRMHARRIAERALDDC